MVTRRKQQPKRDREATEERILQAVGRVLARHGFADLGVNTIAREAGVDKVLIYRYFGGLPELLAAFARRAEFWPTETELAPGDRATTASEGEADRSIAVLKGLLRGLRQRSLAQEVLRWELAASNELTEKLAAVREEQGLRMLGRITPDPVRDGLDLPAAAAILTAGITYLVLRSKSAPAWLGVSLRDEEGWERIERALETIIRRVVRPADSPRSEP
jgi:AcrR family transcriptional regulator